VTDRQTSVAATGLADPAVAGTGHWLADRSTKLPVKVSHQRADEPPGLAPWPGANTIHKTDHQLVWLPGKPEPFRNARRLNW